MEKNDPGSSCGVSIRGRGRGGAAMRCQGGLSCPMDCSLARRVFYHCSELGAEGLDILYLHLQSLDASGKGKMCPWVSCLLFSREGCSQHSCHWGTTLSSCCLQGVWTAHTVWGVGALTLTGREDSDKPSEVAGPCREPCRNRAGGLAGPDPRCR